MLAPARGGWVIAGSLLVALWLAVLPMPEWAGWARPQWVALVLLYWVLALPNRVGVGVSWLCGLMLDVLEGTPLGLHAFALAVTSYLALLSYQRVRMFVPWQQAGIVLVLIGIHQLLCNWVDTLVGRPTSGLWFLLPSVVSALLWPWLMVLLRGLRRRYRVS